MIPDIFVDAPYISKYLSPLLALRAVVYASMTLTGTTLRITGFLIAVEVRGWSLHTAGPWPNHAKRSLNKYLREGPRRFLRVASFLGLFVYARLISRSRGSVMVSGESIVYCRCVAGGLGGLWLTFNTFLQQMKIKKGHVFYTNRFSYWC